MRLHHILYLLLCAVVSFSCDFDHKIENKQPEEPAELSLSVSLDGFGAEFENGGPSTKASGDYANYLDVITSDIIHSFALCLVKVDPTNLDNSKMVGYRVFLRPHESDNKRYFFKNTWGGRDHEGNILEDIPIESVELGIYADGNDDTTDPLSDYGANGIFDGNKKARVTFKYEYPMHGKVERLTAGTYVVCAIANFEESALLLYDHVVGNHLRVITRYWQRNLNNPDFQGVQRYAIPDPTPEQPNRYFRGYHQIITGRLTLGDSNVEYYYGGAYHNTPQYNSMGEMIHNDSETDDDGAADRITSPSYIRKKDSRILSSWSQFIQLSPGENSFHLSLERDVARVTVTLNNESSVPLTISDMSFSDNFAAAAGYLFGRTGDYTLTPMNWPKSWMGAPVVRSDRAIIPFAPTQLQAAGENIILFDALTLPNWDKENQMSMSLTMEAEGIRVHQQLNTTANYINVNGISRSLQTVLNDDTYWPVGEERYFAIQYASNNRFLISTADNAQPTVSGENITNIGTLSNYLTANTVGDEYLWILKKVNDEGTRKVIIRNKKYTGWLRPNGNVPNNNNGVAMSTTNEGSASMLTLPSSGNNIRFRGYRGRDFFFRISNSNLIACRTSATSYTAFNLYELETSTSDTHVEHIPLTYFNDLDGVVRPLHRIRRNQHLNIHINVRFNEETQQFEFEVLDWNKKNQGVIFN